MDAQLIANLVEAKLITSERVAESMKVSKSLLRKNNSMFNESDRTWTERITACAQIKLTKTVPKL